MLSLRTLLREFLLSTAPTIEGVHRRFCVSEDGLIVVPFACGSCVEELMVVPTVRLRRVLWLRAEIAAELRRMAAFVRDKGRCIIITEDDDWLLDPCVSLQLDLASLAFDTAMQRVADSFPRKESSC